MKAQIVADGLGRQVFVFEGLAAASKPQLRRLLTRSLIAIEREAKIRARSGGVFSTRSTGMLARKIGWKIIGDGVGVITSGVKYGMIQEFGGQTKPHDIYPRNGKALAFAGWKGAGAFSNAASIGNSKKLHSIGSGALASAARRGKTITGKTVLNHVHHPGSKIPGTHYTADSFAAVEPKITEDAQRLLESLTGGKAWP